MINGNKIYTINSSLMLSEKKLTRFKINFKYFFNRILKDRGFFCEAFIIFNTAMKRQYYFNKKKISSKKFERGNAAVNKISKHPFLY